MRTLLPLLLLATLASPGLAQKDAPKLPDLLDVEIDVEYGKAGERALLLDVVRPKKPAAEKLPALVFIQGGGWSGGDKSGGRGGLAAFASSGKYVGFTVGYRLSGEAIWPAQIHDCKAAIRWVRANAEKYGVDPERIGVWGGSAGGHLVSLLGTSGDVAELEGENGSPDASSRVTCVVNFCGPTDFLLFDDKTFAGGRIASLLGGKIADKQAEAKVASPITYVTKDDPPFLTVHGSVDDVVPVQQAEVLHERLQAAGVDSHIAIVEGAGHGFGGPEVFRRVSDFLAKHLHGEEKEITSDPIKQEAKKPEAKKQ
jgi:acetyl esterase/lipase